VEFSICDAILFKDGVPSLWLFTAASDGLVKRKRASSFSFSDFKNELLALCMVIERPVVTAIEATCTRKLSLRELEQSVDLAWLAALVISKRNASLTIEQEYERRGEENGRLGMTMMRTYRLVAPTVLKGRNMFAENGKAMQRLPCAALKLNQTAEAAILKLVQHASQRVWDVR
jgi:hypothetical protein